MIYKADDLIYAAGADILNTFRIDIDLTEAVNEKALCEAVNSAAERFPYFSIRLVRRGEEYLLEHNDMPFVISRGAVGAALGSAENNYHLFSVTYENDTVCFHTSHFITDGNGSFPFIRTIMYLYLHILHPNEIFDTAQIALPGSPVPPEEADDDPYPDKPLPCTPLVEAPRPTDIMKLDDLYEQAENGKEYISFRLAIDQKELMSFVSSADGSPATFIASVMYKTITELHPDEHLPVVCGMQHQFRRALGKPFSHNCHVNIVPMVYPDSVRKKSIEKLNTISRGMLILRASDENDLLTVNACVRNREHIRTHSLGQKQRFMRRALLKGIGRNTFEVSYTGRVPWCGLDKYIKGVAPYIDMSLSGGISIEIFSVGRIFDINIMQISRTECYFDRFCELLGEFGISFTARKPSRFELSSFCIPSSEETI